MVSISNCRCKKQISVSLFSIFGWEIKSIGNIPPHSDLCDNDEDFGEGGQSSALHWSAARNWE